MYLVADAEIVLPTTLRYSSKAKTPRRLSLILYNFPMLDDTAVFHSSADANEFQVGYCTNVHSGADLLATRANLEKYALAVKQQVSPDGPMAVGLWLSAQAAEDLLRHELTEAFADWLGEVGLVPFTLNGFPYGDFHADIVKHAVYQPDWTDIRRRRYTENLIQIMDRLLAPGAEGSISTLPLAWGNPPPEDSQWVEFADGLRRIASRLKQLEQETGRLIYVCIEPEPGCVLQRGEDVIRFFEDRLLADGDEHAVRRYLRVCHDICHGAVMFEDQGQVLQRYQDAGIQIGKVQISSAIVLRLDALPHQQRASALEQLREFSEDRYLHQTLVRRAADESPVFFEDLPAALDQASDPSQWCGEWRVHHHVPIYLDRFGALETSQQDILLCLEVLKRSGQVRHFEVETYGWGILPRSLRRAGLADCIADELLWLREHF